MDDLISRQTYEQVMWERDIAIQQLKELGYEFGEKIRTDGNTISRQAVLDLAKKGVIVSNGNYKSVCKAINELPSVNLMPCEDAISRQAALDPYKILDDTDTLCVKLIRSNILQQPPVNPTKTGHWIDEFGGCECSECGWLEGGYSDFCPNCGAKMIEPQESEDKE